MRTSLDEKVEMDAHLVSQIECLLFVAGEPVTIEALARATEREATAIYPAIHVLRQRYADSGLQIVEIANGFQMATRTEFAETVGRFMAPNANRLSKPALETVTIIAYRQPCTQAEIEAVRGVACDGVLKTLESRELIREAGRKATPGRPRLYATTDAFLHYFGLSSLADLPPLETDEDMVQTPMGNAPMELQTTLILSAAGVELDNWEPDSTIQTNEIPMNGMEQSKAA